MTHIYQILENSTGIINSLDFFSFQSFCKIIKHKKEKKLFSHTQKENRIVASLL